MKISINLSNLAQNKDKCNNKLSFQSIKPTIRLGEKFIRELKMEYPDIKSPSMLGTRTDHAKDLPLDVITLLKLIFMENYQYQYLKEMRKHYEKLPLDQYMNIASFLIKKFKIANCGEMAHIMQYKLLEQGIKADLISFKIEGCIKKDYKTNKTYKTDRAYRKDMASSKDRNFFINGDYKKNKVINNFLINDAYRKVRTYQDHEFIVLNMAKSAVLHKPETWGSKAVIVDPWLGRCRPAHEMILEYECLFRLDEERECLIFYDKNGLNVDEYLEMRKLKTA